MWAQVKKFAPFAAILGYIMVYTSKGYDRILTDIQGITIQKLTAKWQNFLIAVIAAAGIYFLKHVKLPAALKAIITLVLFFVIGYNMALAIDPPNGNSPQYYRYTGNERNRYALGRG